MNNIHEYYDNMADISVKTRDAISNLESAKKNVEEALVAIKKLKKESDMTISSVSTVTTRDVHRNLLFLELLLNQVIGLTIASDFMELLDLTGCFYGEIEEF